VADFAASAASRHVDDYSGRAARHLLKRVLTGTERAAPVDITSRTVSVAVTQQYASCMPLKNGGVFAGFVIERFIGSGAMGEVYLARHPRLPRLDALKVLPAALTDNVESGADSSGRPTWPRPCGIRISSAFTTVANSMGSCGFRWIM
jgi:serine/threonine protein kinase